MHFIAFTLHLALFATVVGSVRLTSFSTIATDKNQPSPPIDRSVVAAAVPQGITADAVLKALSQEFSAGEGANWKHIRCAKVDCQGAFATEVRGHEGGAGSLLTTHTRFP